MINEIYVAGGLGDCLFYTPLIRYLYNVKQTKVIVYVHMIQHSEILKNNPYCDVLLIDYDEFPNLLDEQKLNYSEKANQKYVSQPYYYTVCLPTLSLKLKASSVIGKNFNVELLNNNLDIFLSDKEAKFGRKIVSKFKNPITINPTSTSSKNQLWYIERWNEVIFRLKDYTFIQIGLETEHLLDGVIDFRGGYSLRQQLSILANSKLHIGLDSFWSHAAAALNTKAIVLFGQSTPITYGQENNFNIFKNLSCSPCFDWINGCNCPYSKKCMDLITVDDVVNSVKSLLSE